LVEVDQNFDINFCGGRISPTTWAMPNLLHLQAQDFRLQYDFVLCAKDEVEVLILAALVGDCQFGSPVRASGSSIYFESGTN